MVPNITYHGWVTMGVLIIIMGIMSNIRYGSTYIDPFTIIQDFHTLRSMKGFMIDFLFMMT